MKVHFDRSLVFRSGTKLVMTFRASSYVTQIHKEDILVSLITGVNKLLR